MARPETAPVDVPVPRVNAEAGVHEAAHRLLEPLPRGRLYDLATGEGAIARWASDRGFDVAAFDVDPGPYTQRHIPFVAANLDGRWPMPDGEGDVVVALELIEHLENHFAFMREAARVLRPGGRLVLSTPNEHCIQNRWCYFRTGFFGGSRRVIRHDSPNPAAEHVHMAPLPQLELAWRRAGFELERFEVSRLSGSSMLMLPFWVLQTLSLRQRMLGARVDPGARELNRRLYPLFADVRLFLGRVAVFSLVRRGP